MKRYLQSIVILAIIIIGTYFNTSVSATAQDDVTNMVINGGFENSDINLYPYNFGFSNTNAQPWGRRGIKFSYVTDSDKVSGLYSLKVRTDIDPITGNFTTSGITQPLNGLVADKTYYFSAYVKTIDEGSVERIRFTLRSSDAKFLHSSTINANSSEWQRITWSTTNLSGDYTLIIGYPSYKSGNKTPFLIDEVYAGEILPGEIPIENNNVSQDVYSTITEIFVSPNGDESNDGSITMPLKSLEAARDRIRDIKKDYKLPIGGITVFLRGGTYNITKSFVLDERDSGTEISPIIYKPYNNEKVIFTGGTTIDGWKFNPVEHQNILERIPENARGKVYSISLSSLGITDFGSINSYDMKVYYNDNPMTLSRYPNENEFMLTGRVIDRGSVPRNGEKPDRGAIFEYKDNRVERWGLATDIFLYGFFGFDYYLDKIAVQSINNIDKTITTKEPAFYGVKFGKRFYAYNLLEEIDLPGEYYIERQNGILYLYPLDENLYDTKIDITLFKDTFFLLFDIHDINIEGLNIENSRGNGIVVDRGINIRIDDVTIKNLSGDSISLFEMKNSGVKDSRIYNVNGTIQLTGGDNAILESGNNYISNNHIHHFDGRISVDGVGNIVSNNKIHSSRYLAVLIGGNLNILEKNEIYNVVSELADYGASYNFMGWRRVGNIIKNNYFHDITIYDENLPHGLMGIYFDGASGFTVEGNIFDNVGSRAAVFSNLPGRYNRVRNNVFVNNKRAVQFAMNSSQGVYETDPSIINEKNWLINVAKWGNEPWASTFPYIQDLFTDNDNLSKGCELVNNVFYRNNEDVYFGYTSVPLEGHKVTVEGNLYYDVNDDLGFVDFTNKDFELPVETSSIYSMNPNFEKIPFYDIGLLPSGAINKVQLAEANPILSNIVDAKNEVNLLINTPTKRELLSRLDVLEDGQASVYVSNAETLKTEESVLRALDYVKNMRDMDKKNLFMSRIKSILAKEYIIAPYTFKSRGIDITNNGLKEGELLVKVSFTNLSNELGLSSVFFAGLYKNGELVDITAIKDINGVVVGDTKIATLKINVPIGDGYSIKVFSWKNIETLIPFGERYEFK